jgi:hypothetical protein
MAAVLQTIKSSFRDPGSQVFAGGDEGGVYRLIRAEAVPHYRKLMESGLYAKLIAEKLLVPHEDVTQQRAFMKENEGDIIIRPHTVPFISYPFEWNFSALKEAALNTLAIQKLCLDHGMTLQDATAFNMQFLNGRWTMIDTGSFHQAPVLTAWGAYRQFCQHFLAPLLLMTYGDTKLLSLFARNLDGIPLDIAAKLLPLKARLQPSIYMHIVMHSRYMARDFSKSESATAIQARPISRASAYGLIDQLAGMIRKLNIRKTETVWTEYETSHTYQPQEFLDKESFIASSFARIGTGRPLSVWDLGANTGHFSRLMANIAPQGSSIVAFEYDDMTVEAGYAASRSCDKNKPLHLWMDLLNPTPDSGWAQQEWKGLIERGPADMVLVLALVHHLCLSGNISFPQLVSFLSRIAGHMIIEFVPKDDPQSRRLLKTRKDVYQNYHQAAFESAMSQHFTVLETKTVSSTGRTLYLMKNHA